MAFFSGMDGGGMGMMGGGMGAPSAFTSPMMNPQMQALLFRMQNAQMPTPLNQMAGGPQMPPRPMGGMPGMGMPGMPQPPMPPGAVGAPSPAPMNPLLQMLLQSQMGQRSPILQNPGALQGLFNSPMGAQMGIPQGRGY